MGILAKFFALFWGWADYRPKDWSRAPINEATLLEIISMSRWNA